MIVLKEREVCPYTNNCPYVNNCQGANPTRNNMFTCEYTNNGIIESDKSRNLHDLTGKMEIISE